MLFRPLKVLMAVRRSSVTVTVFTPPAVEPGEPPMNISSIVITVDAGVRLA